MFTSSIYSGFIQEMYYCVSMYSTYHVFSECLFCCRCFLFTLFDGNVEWNYGFKFSFKHCSNDNNGRQEREKSNVEWVRELNMKKTRNDDDNITLTVTTMQTHIQILASRTKLFISMNLIGFFPLPPSFSTHCVDRLKSAGWFCVLFFLPFYSALCLSISQWQHSFQIHFMSFRCATKIHFHATSSSTHIILSS